jgi:RecA-family ATPase
MTVQRYSLSNEKTTLRVAEGTDLNAINSPFIGKTANEWLQQAATKPMPKQLFDKFWFENELSVLFASTNTGKSNLAVQIATDIASGMQRHPWRVTCGPQKVLFFDFELSDRQFARRYSEEDNGRYVNLYNFPQNFIRYERQPAAPPDGIGMVDYYIQSIRTEVERQQARIIVIDNITWINSRLEKAAEAGAFMQQLSNLKKDAGLSILLIAHTPKRDASTPITINDLAGSAQLMNFLDSSFAIGCSRQDPQLRYIKQIKVRECEMQYGDENVMLCMLEKPHNFLSYRFIEYAAERDHLRQQSETDKSERDSQIIDLYEELKSYRAVANQIGVSHQTVKRVIANHVPSEENDEVPF